MEITSLIIPTAVASPGMSVAEVFRECVRADVPGIPFRDATGRITGKASIRHVLKEKCIPDFMVKHSHLLGDDLGRLHIQQEHAREVLDLPIDPFVLPHMAVANPTNPLAKVLAVMEDVNTTYLFVIEDGEYLGIVTVMGIARAILSHQ